MTKTTETISEIAPCSDVSGIANKINHTLAGAVVPSATVPPAVLGANLKITDIIFGNPKSQQTIWALVSGAHPMPFMGTCGILLHGVWGTGKTALARLLPDALEIGKTGQDCRAPHEFIACIQGQTGPQAINLIQQQLQNNPFNASGLHYFVLDEVDNLTRAAQTSLKSMLNARRAVLILTTNHVSTLDRGLLNRCICIDMNAATDLQLLPLARAACDAAGGQSVTDQELLAQIPLAQGSIRRVTRIAQDMAGRRDGITGYLQTYLAKLAKRVNES